MTTLITPITELEAVNILIGTVGMVACTSLDVDDVDVQQAHSTLTDVSRQVQSQGWDFNTEDDYSLSPDSTTGEITIPPNIVTVKLSGCFRLKYDTVVRGGKLYDRKKHSTAFTETVKAKVTMLFQFEELPQALRQYITIRAARVFQDRAEGLADAHTFSQNDEQTAWIALQNYEAETADFRYSTR